MCASGHCVAGGHLQHTQQCSHHGISLKESPLIDRNVIATREILLFEAASRDGPTAVNFGEICAFYLSMRSCGGILQNKWVRGIASDLASYAQSTHFCLVFAVS